MTLFHIERHDEYQQQIDRGLRHGWNFVETDLWPYESIYTTCGNLVVRAASENEARTIAMETNPHMVFAQLYTCTVLDPDGPAEFIIGDFPTG